VSVPGACVTRPARRPRGPAPGPDEIVQEGGHRMFPAAPPDRRIRRPPAGRAHPHPPRTGRLRYAQAAPLVTPCLPDRRDRLKGDALIHRPPGSAAYPRPATARAGHRPRGRPGAVPVPQSGRTGGKADQRLPGHLPSSAAGMRTPCVGAATSRAFPRPDTALQGPRDINHSRYFRYPHGIHRTRAVIRICRRLSTGLFTARPQVTGCNSGNTGTAVAACNQLILS